jgi:hypothetical protein
MLSPTFRVASPSASQAVAAMPITVTPTPAWATAVPQAERGRPEALRHTVAKGLPRLQERVTISFREPRIR